MIIRITCNVILLFYTDEDQTDLLACHDTFICVRGKQKKYSALLWQMEASDILSKSELLKFLHFTQCALLPGQILIINTHPAKRYVR